MKKNDLSVFKMEKEGFKIKLKKGVDFQQVLPIAPPLQAAPQPMAHAAPEPEPAAAPKEPGKEIVSPMVGTFYSAASPESAPFVEIGQEVNPDTVVCIIEAMKVMNEIKAEQSGVITELLAENGGSVQFGQPLFRLK